MYTTIKIDRVIATMKVEKDKISRPYFGDKAKLTKESTRALTKYRMRTKTELEKLGYVLDPITKHLSLWMHYWVYLDSKALETKLVII